MTLVGGAAASSATLNNTAVATTRMLTEFKEIAFQMFSLKVKRFWDEWELRGLVLLSLTLQIVLAGIGCPRKYTASVLSATIVWLAYLSADWVAAFSLSGLMKSETEMRTAFMAFWAPFLLLHLGGPDTITAYSLEDNDLWLRHFLGLCFQVAVAIYVYWRFQTNNAITFLVIPIFVAGIIKYGERIWILRCASSKNFKNSTFSVPEPKFDEVAKMSRSEERVDLDTYLSRMDISPKARYLHKAYFLLKVFKPLFAGMHLRIYRELNEIFNIGSYSTTWAFRLIEVELGFLYDMLYTKRTLLSHRVGAILRFICFLSSCSTLVAFSLIVGFGKTTDSKVDIGISYLLLFGAVALDIYSVIAHGLSDWAMLWVTGHKSWRDTFVYRAIAFRIDSMNGKEELQSMGQCNFISFCLKSSPSMIAAIQRFLNIGNFLSDHSHTTLEHVNFDLREMIFYHILEKYKQYEEKDYDYVFLTVLLAKRGNGVLEEKGILGDFRWSITEVEFSKSLLLWHIATDLCYYADGDKYGTDILGSHYKLSKSLSDYIMYLLVMRPSLFPQAINELVFRDTGEELKKFLSWRHEFDSSKASMTLLFGSEDRPNIQIPGKSKSVLFVGVGLANQLQSLVSEDRCDHEEKWEIISHVWVEMLTYVASNCVWKEHAQQLNRGTELLTHVSLLMAHLGLTTKIQMVSLPIELQLMNYTPLWDWDSINHLGYFLA